MVGKRRLTKSTFAVVLETHISIPVPAGQVIEIPVAPEAGAHTVDVIWNGEKLMMFVRDLGDRSQPID